MTVALQSRLDYLAKVQNPDGGWPYFAGKASWTEPTAWALLAMARDPQAPAYRKGWEFLRSLQLPAGAWRPAPGVDDPHWTTALAVTLLSIRGVRDEAFAKAVDWMLATTGAEGRWTFRLAHALHPKANEMDYSVQGWPWRPGNASWVEPTAHSLVALRKAAKLISRKEIDGRVQTGEAALLDRRCVDAGWNYGNRRVLEANLESYPDTTAVALIGLQSKAATLDASRQLALRYWRESRSHMALAWLALALRIHGVAFEDAREASGPGPDVLVAALEAVGAPDGNYGLLRVGEA